MEGRKRPRPKEPILKKVKMLQREVIPLKVDDMFIFHKEIARGHRSPFGIAKILEIRKDGTIHFQWYGNYFYNANGTFLPGWKNLSEDLGYYGRKISRLVVAWTGDTKETVTSDIVIAAGTDLLGKDKKLTARERDLIATAVKQM